MRKPQELATEYLAALCKLACKCVFQGLDQAMLDQFTRGQTDLKLKRKLIVTRDITLKKAREIADDNQVSQEEHQLRNQTTARMPAVHQLQREYFRTLTRMAYTVRQTPIRTVSYSATNTHSPFTCHFHDATSRVCSNVGYIARPCISKPASDLLGGARLCQTSHIHKDLDVLTLQVLNLPTENKDQIYVTVQIEGSLCKMHLDTVIHSLSQNTAIAVPHKTTALKPGPFRALGLQKKKHHSAQGYVDVPCKVQVLHQKPGLICNRGGFRQPPGLELVPSTWNLGHWLKPDLCHCTRLQGGLCSSSERSVMGGRLG